MYQSEYRHCQVFSLSHWGEATTLLKDFEELIKASEAIGLMINPDKCELFFTKDQDQATAAVLEQREATIEDFKILAPNIKGTPIINDPHVCKKKIV